MTLVPMTTAMRCGHCSRWRFFSAARAGKCPLKVLAISGNMAYDRHRAGPPAGPPRTWKVILLLWNRRNGHTQHASMATAQKPMARSLDLIVQEVDDEVLIYDEFNARAHCLS